MSKTIDDFTSAEALDALYYCRRNVNVCRIYLDNDRKHNPHACSYSEFKLAEALEDLEKAEARVKAFGLSFLDPKYYD